MTVLAIKSNDNAKIVAVNIPQFEDKFGQPAKVWAQIYVTQLEKSSPADGEFLFKKIREQYPDVQSKIWA